MDGAVAFVTFMTEPANMAQLMKGSLDVVPAFPEVLQVKGMRAWLDSRGPAAAAGTLCLQRHQGRGAHPDPDARRGVGA